MTFIAPKSKNPAAPRVAKDERQPKLYRRNWASRHIQVSMAIDVTSNIKQAV